jgi:hypothetical protein
MMTARFQSPAVSQSAWHDRATGIVLPFHFIQPADTLSRPGSRQGKGCGQAVFILADTYPPSPKTIPPTADPTGYRSNAHSFGSCSIVPAA